MGSSTFHSGLLVQQWKHSDSIPHIDCQCNDEGGKVPVPGRVLPGQVNSQGTALCCAALHYTALHCTSLHSIPLHCTALFPLQGLKVHGSKLSPKPILKFFFSFCKFYMKYILKQIGSLFLALNYQEKHFLCLRIHNNNRVLNWPPLNITKSRTCHP